MLIDILFLIMTGFGFYFGYAYGPIKIVIFVVSVTVSLGVSMYFTPTLTQIIRDTFELDSPLLPFLSFTLMLILVLLLSRLIFGMFSQVAENQKFNLLSQVLGGILMTFTFTFLFSSLVTFFSEAEVLKPDRMEKTSFFYKYVEQIPEYGQRVLQLGVPFVQDFARYMNIALQRLQKGDSALRKSRRKLIEKENGETEEVWEEFEEDSANTLPILEIKADSLQPSHTNTDTTAK